MITEIFIRTLWRWGREASVILRAKAALLFQGLCEAAPSLSKLFSAGLRRQEGHRRPGQSPRHRCPLESGHHPGNWSTQAVNCTAAAHSLGTKGNS